MNKFCPNCGKENNAKSNFCASCGTDLQKGSNNQNINTGSSNQKSKIAAGILGILVGYLGIHNFYLGYTGKAITQLLLTVFSCGILSVASGIWGLVEGIMILTGSIDKDANGIPLKD